MRARREKLERVLCQAADIGAETSNNIENNLIPLYCMY
jgi:hypothetical protein